MMTKTMKAEIQELPGTQHALSLIEDYLDALTSGEYVAQCMLENILTTTYTQVQDYVDQNRSLVSLAMRFMYACNQLLEGCGVEGWTFEGPVGTEDKNFSYINMGDIYVPTIIYDTHNNKHPFSIMSESDFRDIMIEHDYVLRQQLGGF